MKKGLSFVLIFLMLAALCVPAFAAGGVAQLRLEQYYADMPDIDAATSGSSIACTRRLRRETR